MNRSAKRRLRAPRKPRNKTVEVDKKTQENAENTSPEPNRKCGHRPGESIERHPRQPRTLGENNESMPRDEGETNPATTKPKVENNKEETTFDISVLTEKFVKRYRSRKRASPRILKELEINNEVLAKHLDLFKNHIGQLEAEVESHVKTNNDMQTHLDTMRASLVEAFQQMTVPGWELGPPTVDNVEAFLQYALNFTQSASEEHDQLRHNIRDMLAKAEEIIAAK